MGNFCAGPMFEPAKSEYWKSITGERGGHYNLFRLTDATRGMAAIREFFGAATCNYMNFLLLSTSGVHGSYTSLDEIEASLVKYGEGEPTGEDWPEDYAFPEVTFVIVQPRLVCLRYGNTRVSLEDIKYLRSLSPTTVAAVQTILAGAMPKDS
jgi:hypothetical protein